MSKGGAVGMMLPGNESEQQPDSASGTPRIMCPSRSQELWSGQAGKSRLWADRFNDNPIFRNNSNPNFQQNDISPQPSRGLDRSRSAYGRKQRKPLGWEGFNKKIADSYLNVDGSATSNLSPCASRQSREAAELAQIIYNKDMLLGMNVMEIRKVIFRLTGAVDALSLENKEVTRDQNKIQEENNRLVQQMAKICESINEDLLVKSQECLSKSSGTS